MTATETRPSAATAATPAGTRVRPAAALLVATGFPGAGLVFVAAYRTAAHAHELFWAAVVLGLASTAGVVALATDRRRACLALTPVLAVLLSVPKFLRAPWYFTFYDEQAHLRATQHLLDGGALFGPNPLNQVVADYPGLHAVTATVAAATGGSVYAAGTAVILVARVAGCLAVFLLAERLLRGPVPALVAVVVFAANPAFAFFDAQFAYESLAAPLVAVVLLLAVRLPEPGTLAAAVGLTALVVVSHHASSYVLAGLLVLVLLVNVVTRRRLPLRPAALAVFAVAATAGWLVLAGRQTLAYVGPYVRSNLTAVPEFVGGQAGPRRLFAGFLPVPAYERVASFAAVFVLLGLFGWGAAVLLRRRADFPNDPVAAWLVLPLGAVYFASLPLVALRGDQAVKRLWEFAFVGLAPVCAAALWALARRGTAARAVAAAMVLVVFVGSAVARSGEHIRFPGPYLPSSDPRAMTPDVVAAARWLDARYGPDHRITGDRTLAAVFGGIGRQAAVTYQEDGYPIWAIFTPDELTPEVLAEVRRAGLQWLAVDRRAAGVFPLTGFYFDESEPGAYVDTRLTDRGLTKFDTGGFRRLYDNGNVVLYRVVST